MRQLSSVKTQGRDLGFSPRTTWRACVICLLCVERKSDNDNVGTNTKANIVEWLATVFAGNPDGNIKKNRGWASPDAVKVK